MCVSVEIVLYEVVLGVTCVKGIAMNVVLRFDVVQIG